VEQGVTQGEISPKVVGDALEMIATCLRDLRALPQASLDEFLADRRNPAAAESLLRRAIQVYFDLLRHLLSKTSGRGVLEYKELARAAAEDGLIRDPHLARVALQIAGFRNRLVHFYQEVTGEEMYSIVSTDLGDLEKLAEEAREAVRRLRGGAGSSP
jgi:uncharacterized protein YutE (UPF0331/DUF86 family)